MIVRFGGVPPVRFAGVPSLSKISLKYREKGAQTQKVQKVADFPALLG